MDRRDGGTSCLRGEGDSFERRRPKYFTNSIRGAVRGKRRLCAARVAGKLSSGCAVCGESTGEPACRDKSIRSRGCSARGLAGDANFLRRIDRSGFQESKIRSVYGRAIEDAYLSYDAADERGESR